MKENALLAMKNVQGGARIVADTIKELSEKHNIEIHIVAHSAGSIFNAPLIQYLTSKNSIETGPLKKENLTGLGFSIATCTLWAPACTTALFKECYLPAIKNGQIKNFSLFTLTDKAEQDDHCAKIYNKSLLYLVSNAFEDRVRIPLLRPDGEPILGMEKFIRSDSTLKGIFKLANVEWIVAPNNEPIGSLVASRANCHGDFDDDNAIVSATLARIVGRKTANAEWNFRRSTSSKRAIRRQVERA
jgi:hypothetical protein